MAGYFTLRLDTTNPNIVIYAPPYSDRQSNNEIRVVSNEKLSTYQDIYIIDSQGTRHDVIFLLDNEEMEYVGNIVFTDFPTGIATIYAQLKDEVDNISNLASKTINIITSHDSLMLRISISSKEASVNLSMIESNVLLSTKESKVILYNKESDVTIRSGA